MRLFPSEFDLKKRSALLKHSKRGKRHDAQLFERLLELDPDDVAGLDGLAEIKLEAGDYTGAVQLYWRLIRAHPLHWIGYLGLSTALARQPENSRLAVSMNELAFRKLVFNDELLDQMGSKLPLDLGEIDGMEELKDLSRREQLLFMADQMLQRRDLESIAVTKQLRPYRLLQKVQENSDLDEELVDALLEERSDLAPLLVGVLREWALEELPEDQLGAVEDALGLLGEVGGASVIPYLLEFTADDSPDLSGAACWALDRLMERHPDDCMRTLSELRPSLEGLELDFAEQLLRGESAGDQSEELTIYDICAGQAIYDPGNDEDEEDEFDEDEFDEDELIPPEPVMRNEKPARNAPCWCGSGRKYKKCHLEADEAGARSPAVPAQAPVERTPSAAAGEFDAVRKKLGEFLFQATTKGELKRATAEFSDRKEDPVALIDWLVHDWVPPSLGRTVMEEYLRRHGSKMSPRERNAVESWARSYCSLYEVTGVKVGVGLELKDLITGEAAFVHDVSMSKTVVRWDNLLTRTVRGERGLELAGVGLSIPRNQASNLLKWMKSDQKRSGLSWPEYLKQNLPRIRRQSDRISEDWIDGLQLQNRDGEDILQSKAVYRVSDESSMTAALDAMPDSLNRDGDTYTWLGGPLDDGRKVLGTIRLQPGELVLESNSKERLELGKQLLAGLPAGSLTHVRDEFMGQAEMKRRIMETPRPEPSSRESDRTGGLPPEIANKVISRFMREHYEKWPEIALPALAGKTPRQAVETASGRKKVVELLKDFENGEERSRRAGEPYYDVNLLRAELGLND